MKCIFWHLKRLCSTLVTVVKATSELTLTSGLGFRRYQAHVTRDVQWVSRTLLVEKGTSYCKKQTNKHDNGQSADSICNPESTCY